MPTATKIAIENINHLGQTSRVDAEKYHAMRTALLKVLPGRAPGLSQAEMAEAVLVHLPEALWPGGEKVMWWVKAVQLDLEARGQIGRTVTPKPMRWHRL